MRRQASALLLCAAAGLGLTHGASAADMRPRAAPVPMAAPVYNWTGLYVGLHAGWGFGQSDASVSFLPSPAAANVANFGYAQDVDGFLAGGQIGFNYQIANWVIGIEADLSWTDINGGATAGPLATIVPPLPIAASSQTSTYDMNWFGTVRGRLGFAANNLLVYVTGGLAYADIDYTAVTSLPPFVALFTASGSATRTGWTFGGGFEWGFAPNWSVKAEYLYYDLGDTTIAGLDPATPGFTALTTFDNDGHILRVGVNYRFGGSAPVVARY